MAVTITTKKGKKMKMLNPSEKGNKFAKELSLGYHHTNDMQFKTDKNGEVKPLTREERAYRSGYLDARKDSANCWKAKNKKK